MACSWRKYVGDLFALKGSSASVGEQLIVEAIVIVCAKTAVSDDFSFSRFGWRQKRREKE